MDPLYPLENVESILPESEVQRVLLFADILYSFCIPTAVIFYVDSTVFLCRPHVSKLLQNDESRMNGCVNRVTMKKAMMLS